MTPFVPAAPAAPVTVAPLAIKPVASGSETSAAAPAILGAQAVTQTQAVKPAQSRDEERKRHEPPEIPPDPPPLKGLGIPPLHTARVGDFDRIETPPPPDSAESFAESRASFEESGTPQVDVRR